MNQASLPPLWVRAADILSAVLLALALSVVCFGGIQLFYGAARISITRPWRVVIILVAVAGVRHLLCRKPAVWTEATAALRAVLAFARSRTVRAVLPAWLALRIGIIVVGLLAVGALGFPPQIEPAPERALRDLTARWDTTWYLETALRGYRWDPSRAHRQQNVAFFPAYPMLMHIGGGLLGSRPDPPLRRPESDGRLRERTLLAGWLVSLGAAFWALCQLHAWASATVGAAAARRSVLLLSAFPFAFYYSVAYTEPLFLLASLGTFNAVSRARPGALAAWGLLAGLLRPNGFILSLPLLMLAGVQQPRARLIASATAPCAGMLIFSAYMWHLTGRPFVWAEAHAAWGRSSPGFDAILKPLTSITEHGLVGHLVVSPYDALNGLAVVFALVLVPAVWRRLGAAPAVFVLASLLPPLLSGGVLSMGRLVSTLFPLFVALSVHIPQRQVPVWAALFALLQGLAAALFFTWRPLV